MAFIADLLALPKEELYAYYLGKIASKFVLGKSERGKKACFYLWRTDLENKAVLNNLKPTKEIKSNDKKD